jgi:hypothetical protein
LRPDAFFGEWIEREQPFGQRQHPRHIGRAASLVSQDHDRRLQHGEELRVAAIPPVLECRGIFDQEVTQERIDLEPRRRLAGQHLAPLELVEIGGDRGSLEAHFRVISADTIGPEQPAQH